jgi:hypothetical protein
MGSNPLFNKVWFSTVVLFWPYGLITQQLLTQFPADPFIPKSISKTFASPHKQQYRFPIGMSFEPSRISVGSVAVAVINSSHVCTLLTITILPSLVESRASEAIILSTAFMIFTSFSSEIVLNF